MESSCSAFCQIGKVYQSRQRTVRAVPRLWCKVAPRGLAPCACVTRALVMVSAGMNHFLSPREWMAHGPCLEHECPRMPTLQGADGIPVLRHGTRCMRADAAQDRSGVLQLHVLSAGSERQPVQKTSEHPNPSTPTSTMWTEWHLCPGDAATRRSGYPTGRVPPGSLALPRVDTSTPEPRTQSCGRCSGARVARVMKDAAPPGRDTWNKVP